MTLSPCYFYQKGKRAKPRDFVTKWCCSGEKQNCVFACFRGLSFSHVAADKLINMREMMRTRTIGLRNVIARGKGYLSLILEGIHCPSFWYSILHCFIFEVQSLLAALEFLHFGDEALTLQNSEHYIRNVRNINMGRGRVRPAHICICRFRGWFFYIAARLLVLQEVVSPVQLVSQNSVPEYWLLHCSRELVK
jgi:hypothetical protein